MLKYLSKYIAMALASILVLGCNKDNGSKEEEENWRDWMGVKVMMEKAGFDTKGIKIFMGSPSDVHLYIPDTQLYVHPWIGEKNGKPWIGIACFDSEGKAEDVFLREFVLSERKYAKSITKEVGKGHSVTVDYKYTVVEFLIVDENYTYLGVYDSYGDSDYQFSENPTIYIHDGHKFCGEIANVDFNKAKSGNVGFGNDLLVLNACYATNGEKRYDMYNDHMMRMASMENGGWYLTYPLSHEVLLTVGYYIQLQCVEAAIVNLKTGESPLSQRITDVIGGNDKFYQFKLDSVNGNIFIYKLAMTDEEGKAKTYTVTIDVKENTAIMK